MRIFVNTVGMLSASLFGAALAIVSILPIDTSRSPGGWLDVAIVLSFIVSLLSVVINEVKL